MTVNELIEILEGVRDYNEGGGEFSIIIAGDYEGNNFYDLAGTGFGVWDGEELKSLEDAEEDDENAFVLWP